MKNKYLIILQDQELLWIFNNIQENKNFLINIEMMSLVFIKPKIINYFPAKWEQSQKFFNGTNNVKK